MRYTTFPLVALAFTAGLLLHCDVGVPARAGDQDTAPYRSGSRLKAITLLSADGASIPTGEWWDSKLETRCQPAIAADGKLRCLPVGPGDRVETSIGPSYISADCSGTQAAPIRACLDTGGPLVALRLEGGGADLCSPVIWRVHRRGDKLSARALYFGSACEEHSMSDLNTYYELGEEIDPSEFVLLAESH